MISLKTLLTRPAEDIPFDDSDTLIKGSNVQQFSEDADDYINSIISPPEWDFTLVQYTYLGNPDLIGTTPGQEYHANCGKVANNTLKTQTLRLDLYYDDPNGVKFQFSEDNGTTWTDVSNTLSSISKVLEAGDTLLIRMVYINSSGVIFRMGSCSPYGDADDGFGEVYYMAYQPGAYYDGNWNRDISGNVAVVTI